MQSEVFFVENDIHRRDKTNYYLDLAEAFPSAAHAFDVTTAL